MEQWKDIPGWEGLYQASTSGNARSYDRAVNTRGGNKKIFKGRLLKPKVDKDGYLGITLQIARGPKMQMRLHRIVALTFIPNPKKLEIVGHKDNNPKNNNVGNLEWCTQKQNVRHSINCKRFYRPPFGEDHYLSKPVFQIKEGQIIKRFGNGREAAAALSADSSQINKCANGMRQSAHGYQWKFESDFVNR